MKPRTSFQSKVLTAFTLALVVVGVLLMATWKLAQDAVEASGWVEHTHMVLVDLAQVKADTLQIELSTQNYRLSGNTAFLTERDATVAAREIALDNILRLIADNPRQQERWYGVREVVDERLQISRRIQELRKTQGQEAATAYALSSPLAATREKLYGLLMDMVDEETRLLSLRNVKQHELRGFLLTVGSLSSLFLLALLISTFVLIRRQLQVTEDSRRALEDSEKGLSITLYSIGDAVLATDAKGRVTRMNPVAERLTGWSIDEARGLYVDEVFRIVNELTREPAVVPVGKVLATGKAQDLANHTALIAKDGTECPIADSAAPICDDTGTIHGVVLVFRDVTTEREAELLLFKQNELLEKRVQERTEQLQVSEGHLRSVIGNVPALIAYVDADQRYVYVNEQYRARFAPGRSDIKGCTVREILGDERYGIAEPLILRVLQGESQHYDWEPFPGVWQIISYAPRWDDKGAVSGYYVMGTDITERKASEEQIRTLNEVLAQHVRDLENVSRALRTLSGGNRTMLRAVDEQALLEQMCSVIVNTGGYDAATVWYRQDDEAKTMKIMAECGYPGGVDSLRELKVSWGDNEYGHGAGATAVRTGRTAVVGNMQSDPGYAPWQSKLHDYASVIACPLNVDGMMIGVMAIYDTEPNTFGADEVTLLTESADDLAFGIATLRARAEQQKTQKVMHRLTHYDNLTGLPNEARFTEAVTIALKTGHQPFSLLQINVERLSEINDALGFFHGDQLLCEFGMRLSNAVPTGALVARLRGDEFVILCPECNQESALSVVEQLEQALAPPFQVADIALDVQAKIGVVLYPDHGASTHDLYRNMDIALHQAKRKGLRHEVFDPSQNPDRSRRLTVASELRRAIEEGDLRLYLQPKVAMANGQIKGAEGLVRWQHPERGLIPPGEFIPLAESTGLIKPLTDWVVETAVGLNQSWAVAGCALPIAVNLSALNLRDENLLGRVRQLLRASGTPQGLFEMEITESTVMEDAEFSMGVLYDLRKLGIPLYIDDFGTGYSSLSYLQKLPVEYIKIDQSFVRDMSVNKDSERIVRSTIDLVHDLGRKVVAEGIETREIWDRLSLLGCDIAQGYFIAKPMPAEEFQSWLTAYRAP